MATFETILRRKFRHRWSDLDMLLMCELGKGPRGFSELMHACESSTGGTWNRLEILKNEGLVEGRAKSGRTVYLLTTTGEERLREMLS